MVVINFQDQLQTGTFEYALHYLVEKKLNLSVFHPDYKNDVNGRPAYDPAILLKIILFAYSKGITSSREIQWCCKFNIIFKALSCDTVPHFTTIASFISQHSQAIASVFEQILLVCHEQGLLGNELFAIDGCKMPSYASKEWSGTIKELEEKRKKIKRQIEYHMEAHQQQDKNDVDDEAQQKRRQQTIETLEKAHHKIDHFLNNNEPRKGEGKSRKEVKSNITDNDSAKMTTSKGTMQGYNGLGTADKKHQVIIDAQVFGSGSEQHTLSPIIEAISSRYHRLGLNDDIFQSGVILTADTGFASEDNMAYLHKNEIDAYIPDNQFRSRDPKFQDQRIKHPKPSRAKPKAEQTLPASEFQFDAENLTCQCPAGEMIPLRRQSKDKKGNDKVFFEGRLSQCRHCEQKNQCMRNPESTNHHKGSGRQVSFIINRIEQPPNFTDWMKERIDSEKGKQIYGHRMSIIEPVFGNIGSNKGLRRFSLRGKQKVQDQWRLYCLVHNIEKIQNYGKIAA